MTQLSDLPVVARGGVTGGGLTGGGGLSAGGRLIGVGVGVGG